MKFNRKFSIFNLLFRWKRIKIKVYYVEYLTSSMLQSQKFSYTEVDIHPYTNEIKFHNEFSGQTLSLSLNRLEWYITTEFEHED